MEDQWAEVLWREDEVPVSRRFDDPYFNPQDGLAEARHVFLDGNDLKARLGRPLHVAELGFGSGLNFLALLWLWQEQGAGAPLRFTSFEAFPMRPEEMARTIAPFDPVSQLAGILVDRLRTGVKEVEVLPNAHLCLKLGDARARLPEWDGLADAWFLDGFAPTKNPELWTPSLMTAVSERTVAGGTFATYTAAGHVRRALSEAGFVVERVQGFGRKRHMTRGRKR
ncbi:MAG: tRNA (5-methylaminomethyl-2-thiouridine)(34)-methyltransferase MnmD [Pseudomonadota bacterium]